MGALPLPVALRGAGLGGTTGPWGLWPPRSSCVLNLKKDWICWNPGTCVTKAQEQKAERRLWGQARAGGAGVGAGRGCAGGGGNLSARCARRSLQPPPEAGAHRTGRLWPE